jgi:hypothetical protein
MDDKRKEDSEAFMKGWEAGAAAADKDFDEQGPDYLLRLIGGDDELTVVDADEDRLEDGQ